MQVNHYPVFNSTGKYEAKKEQYGQHHLSRPFGEYCLQSFTTPARQSSPTTHNVHTHQLNETKFGQTPSIQLKPDPHHGEQSTLNQPKQSTEFSPNKFEFSSDALDALKKQIVELEDDQAKTNEEKDKIRKNYEVLLIKNLQLKATAAAFIQKFRKSQE